MAHVLDAVIQLRDNFSSTIRNVEQSIGGFSRTAQKMGRDVQRVGKDVERFGKNLTTHITMPIVAAGTMAVNEFIKIEEAVSGMSKTMDATPEQVQAIKKELDELARTTLPVARTELFGIAETAGQLGIATPDVKDFTTVMAKMGKVSNLDYTEGAASLAQFSNIMGTSSDNFENLGSAIVYLDSNTATTAKDIVDMGMRLAGAGKQAGITEAQVMGIAAGLSSLGLESQAGGSAFSKVILSMNDSVMAGGKELGRFAKVAGMTAQDFQKAFKENASDAMVSFVRGLERVKNEGHNVSAIIEDLGFNELRTKDALLRLSGASEMFADVMGKSNKAWEDNTALAEVFGKMTDNTASKIQIMKNQISIIAENMGAILVPIFNKVIGFTEKLSNGFEKLSDEQKENIVKWAGIAAAIGPVFMIIGKLTTGVGGLILRFGKFAATVKRLGLIGAIFTPGTIVVLIIGAIVVATILLIKNWDKLKAKVNQVFPNMKESIAKTMGHVRNIFDFVAKFLSIVFMPVQLVFHTVWETIKNIFWVGVEFIAGIIGSLIQILSGIIDFVVGVFTGDWERAWNGISDIFGGIIGGFGAIAKGAINGVTGIINGFIGGINKVKVPDWIPDWLGGGKGINIPLIPQLAKGTNNWGGGIVQVHEKGGEIMDLPSGSRVYPHDKSVSMAREQGRKESNRSGDINIAKLADQIIVREEADIDKIADAIARKIVKAKLNYGGAW